MIDNGATTIWERWDGLTEDHGFQSPEMNSFNHYSLGSVGEWLYRYVLGIDQQPGTAGFRRLLLRPHPGGTLRWARGSYQSVRGAISTRWQRTSDHFSYEVQLPPNTIATVHIPSSQPAQVRDNAGNAPASLAIFADTQEAIYHVSAGAHEFTGPAMGESPLPIDERYESTGAT